VHDSLSDHCVVGVRLVKYGLHDLRVRVEGVCRRRGNKRDAMPNAKQAVATTLHTHSQDTHTAFTLTYIAFVHPAPTSAKRMILLGLGWKSKLKSKLKDERRKFARCRPGDALLHIKACMGMVTQTLSLITTTLSSSSLSCLEVRLAAGRSSRSRRRKKKQAASQLACMQHFSSTHT